MTKTSYKYVWVLQATSESSDHYGPWVFAAKPSEDVIESFLREECPGEWPEEEDGCNWRGSYLIPELNQTRIFEADGT